MKRCGKTMLSFSRQFNVEYTWCVCRVLCSFNFISWSSRITVLHPLFTVALLPTVKNLCQNYFFKKQYLCDKVFAMLIHLTKNPYRYRKFKNICYWNCCRAGWMNTAQKIKFSIKDFFSGCGQIRSCMQIWSNLLKKSLARGGLWAVSNVESSVRAPRIPRFILLGSFSDTLLVVSILDIVYDCHL